MKTYAKATLVGLTAPLCWGMSVGVIRTIVEQFKLSAGLTILYGTIVLLLCPIIGLPKLKKFPLKYLLFGIPFANMCSVFFGISMFLCQNERQTVEVGMVNYMWPCLVILFSIFINGQKARWWVVPGAIISVAGIMIVLGGDKGVNLAEIAQNVGQNPASYILALMGAVSWGIFANLTRKYANGNDPTIIIFFVDFVIFALIWAGGMSGGIANADAFGWASVVLGALVFGGAYVAWNYGISRGNMTLLAIASYFTPVLSCLFAAAWLGAPLGKNLLLGVAVLVAGSIMTWSATHFPNKPRPFHAYRSRHT